MELVILGSGTAIPRNDRAAPCMALMHEGHINLFDMGPGALRQLTSAGIAFEKIDRIFFTHFHPDHTSGLIHFLFATRNPSVLEKRSPFLVAGPRGLRKFLSDLQKVYKQWLDLPVAVMNTMELDPSEQTPRDFTDFTLAWRPTGHTPHSIAFRVENGKGKSFVYTGDTGFSETVVDLARQADLLITEASFPQGQGLEGHLTPFQAGQIASEAGVKKLLLIHFYPECLATDIAAQCRRSFRGTLILGRDLLHIRI